MSRRAFVPMLVAVAVSMGCTGGAREALVSDGEVGAQETTHVRVALAGVRAASRRPRSIITLLVGDSVKGATGLEYQVRGDAVLAQDATGRIVAQKLGTTVLVALPAKRGTPPDTIIVRVMTRSQVVNSTVAEVCTNQDSATIVAGQPYGSTLSWIHEYHDCQRLIVDGEYGPPVGIFAHENVARYQSASQFKDGVLAAVIVDFPMKGKSWDYARLGLKPGTNCLVLHWAASQWEAAVVNQAAPFNPAKPNYGDCPDKMSWSDVTDAGAGRVMLLTVKTQHGVDPWGKPIVPPVARWDWDPQAHINYIGIKCGDEDWCEIGPKDFTPSDPRMVAGRELIKGYYDEQFLADASGEHPSNVFGTILPVVDMSSSLPWQRKATLFMRRRYVAPTAAIKYYAGLFLSQYGKTEWGRPGGVGIWSAIRVDTTLDEIAPIGSGSTYYDLRMNGRTNPKASIQFRGHPGDVMVKYPIVRWVWKEKDETTWYSCDPDGCCEKAVADM